MEPTPQQLSRWKEFTSFWKNKVRPSMVKAVATYEVGASLQTFLNSWNYPAQVFLDDDTTRIKKNIDTFNRIDRCISKANIGKYGVRFNVENDIDILAPMSMPAEEYQSDEVVGFSALFLTVVAVGALVVGATWAISKLIEAHNKMITSMMYKRVIEIVEQRPEMAGPLNEALKGWVEENKPQLKVSGLLDKFLGRGSGMIIAAAVGIGVLLFAYSKTRSK